MQSDGFYGVGKDDLESLPVASLPVATVRCEDPGTPEYSLEAGCKEQRNDVTSTIREGTSKYTLLPVVEPGYSALLVRLGRIMPNTKALIMGSRPKSSNGLFTAWETSPQAS